VAWALLTALCMTHDPPPPPHVADLPRERLRRHGVDALSDAELLALVLGTGRPHEPVLTLATRLLGEHGGARGLLRAGPGDLAPVLGFARAARLIGATELARRALSTPLDPRVPYTSSRDVVLAFAPRLADRVDECVYAVVLDARQRPVAERQLAVGGPASCTVGVREVFALAVREGGAAVLLIHNHPSGDPTPSTEDMQLTAALVDAGRALGLPFLDHVIVAREGSFSFLDAGLLRAGPPPAQGVTGGAP
jgi:DNA repair protein RadC